MKPKEDPITEKPKEDPFTEKPKEDPITVKPKEDPITVKPKEDPKMTFRSFRTLNGFCIAKNSFFFFGNGI